MSNPRVAASSVPAAVLLPGDRIIRPASRVPAQVATVDRVDGVVVITTINGEPLILTSGTHVSLRV